jgi:N utilization substance protein B
MTRRHAREVALQTLFSVEVGHHEPGEVLAAALTRPENSADADFVEAIVRGTVEHATELDETIVPLLQGWTLDRLPTIDLLLLRMGVFEMRYRPETPRAVVINEAVELAHKFSTEGSGRFINGVLANVA